MPEKIQLNKVTPMDIQPSRILIAYNEVIKQPGLYIIRKIRDKYSEKFKTYINMEFLNEVSDKDLPFLYAARTIKNPLEWLAISEFDYELNYQNLLGRFKSMYIEMPTTTLFKHIDHYLKAYFITDVYFWSRNYDKRIDFDIQSIYNDNEYHEKVNYVTGPIDKCIDQLKIDFVFYPEITEEMWPIIREREKVVFAFPTYAYNIGEDDLVIGQKETDNNVGIYPIIQLEKDHFFG